MKCSQLELPSINYSSDIWDKIASWAGKKQFCTSIMYEHNYKLLDLNQQFVKRPKPLTWLFAG